jgi:threonine-phosphate decarboxylase
MHIKHGGNLDLISKKYFIQKSDIIDFSSNINPLGLTDYLKDILKNNLGQITKYPDISYSNLRLSISNYVKVDADNILVGNGSTELISTFIRIKNPHNALIISPAYSEYLEQLNLIGCKTTLFPILESDDFVVDMDKLLQSLNNVDLLVICNPNNPTGTILSIEDIKKILNKCKETNTFLMIDETYMEFCFNLDFNNPSHLINLYENLIIIRGTSKFFCIPGLRLGYALCSNQSLITKINLSLNLWSVNTLASICGEYMFADTEFIKETNKLITTQRISITSSLNEVMALKVYESHSNFILVKILNKSITSEDLFEKLIAHNILIRQVTSFDFLDNYFFRFCILKPCENTLLCHHLKAIFTPN